MESLVGRMTQHLPSLFPGHGGFALYVDEGTALIRTPEEKNETFVISMVENPCDWYVDLWVSTAQDSASTLHGTFGSAEDPEPFYDLSNSNITKFANWLSWTQGSWSNRTLPTDGPAVMSLRYWDAFMADGEGPSASSYSDLALDQYTNRYGGRAGEDVVEDLHSFSPQDAADCWVSKEAYMQDVRHCLSEYERISGVELDWRPFADELLAEGGAPDAGRRLSCEHYYTPESAASVMLHDRELFDAFSYSTCCGPRTPPAPIPPAA